MFYHSLGLAKPEMIRLGLGRLFASNPRGYLPPKPHA